MTNHAASGESDRCPLCELGLSTTLTVVSRHRTSTGTVVYARCQCGRLSMWTEPAVTVHGPPQRRTLAAGLVDG